MEKENVTEVSQRSYSKMFTKSKKDEKALENKISELTNDVADLRENNQLGMKLDEMVNDQYNEAEKFKAEATAKSEEITVKDEEIQSLKDDLERKDKEIDKYKDEAIAKSEEVTVKDDKIQSLKDDLERKDKEVEKYKVEASSKSEEVNANSEIVTAKDARISVLENKLESRTVDIDHLKENRFKLLNQLCEMERENKSISEEIEKYMIQVEENSHILSINEATNEVGVNSKLLAMNEDTIELLENELNELKLEVVQYRMAMVELESNKLSLQAMIKANDIKIAEQEKWNSSLVKNNENLLLSLATLAEMKKENGEFASNTMRLMNALNDNNQISDTTIRAQFTGISNLSGSYVYSHPITFAGIDWRIGVKKSDSRLESSLVGEKNDDDKWSYSVFSEFQLISHKSMEIIHRRGGRGSADVYDKGARSWGYIKFISFEDLFDDQKGFVKEDSINVAVEIKGFPLKKSSNFSLHFEPAHFVWDELF